MISGLILGKSTCNCFDDLAAVKTEYALPDSLFFIWNAPFIWFWSVLFMLWQTTRNLYLRTQSKLCDFIHRIRDSFLSCFVYIYVCHKSQYLQGFPGLSIFVLFCPYRVQKQGIPFLPGEK